MGTLEDHAYFSRASPGGYINDAIDLLGAGTGAAYAVNATNQVMGATVFPGSAMHAFCTTPLPVAAKPGLPRYTLSALDDLGTLGGTESRALGINDLGAVVGDSHIAGDGAKHAFCTVPGVRALPVSIRLAAVADLGTLGGANSTAFGINAAGQVVGESELATTLIGKPIVHAFVMKAGRMTDLNTLISKKQPPSGSSPARQALTTPDRSAAPARSAA